MKERGLARKKKTQHSRSAKGDVKTGQVHCQKHLGLIYYGQELIDTFPQPSTDYGFKFVLRIGQPKARR